MLSEVCLHAVRHGDEQTKYILNTNVVGSTSMMTAVDEVGEFSIPIELRLIPDISQADTLLQY